MRSSCVKKGMAVSDNGTKTLLAANQKGVDFWHMPESGLTETGVLPVHTLEDAYTSQHERSG